MSNYFETKSFHHLLVISRIFIFFIIFFISFFHNAFSSELDNLFLRLKQSENPILAKNYESKIWKLWLNNGTSDSSNGSCRRPDIREQVIPAMAAAGRQTLGNKWFQQWQLQAARH